MIGAERGCPSNVDKVLRVSASGSGDRRDLFLKSGRESKRPDEEENKRKRGKKRRNF